LLVIVFDMQRESNAMFSEDSIVTLNQNDLIDVHEFSLGGVSPSGGCNDYPADFESRLTLYVDKQTFGKIKGSKKLCGNWSTSRSNACSTSKIMSAIPRGHISLGIERICGNRVALLQAEFGLTEPMTRVYPLIRERNCDAYSVDTVKVHNNDSSRTVEVEIEVDRVPDPSNIYLTKKLYELYLGKTEPLGATEKIDSTILYRIKTQNLFRVKLEQI